MLTELWSEIRYRGRALFRRGTMERELDDELRFHLEQEAAKYERTGMPRDEAWRRARIAFGGIDRAKEESRSGRGTALIESTFQDLRYAARGIKAAPIFAAGVILTLGLGIGANATMFGIVDRLLLRPPAYLRDASRVHRVFLSKSVDGALKTSESTSWARYRDLAQSTRSFDAIGTFMTMNVAVGDADAVRQVPVAGVSASYIDFFDAPPALGRWFTRAEDGAPHGSPVVVLTYAYWQTQFGGSANVLGERIRIDHTLCTVIGVAPRGFIGMEDDLVPALFIPMTTMSWDLRPGDYTRNYGWGGRVVIVRRKPGISIEMANADLTQAYIHSWIAGGDSTYNGPMALVRPRAFAAPVELARGPDAGPLTKVVAWIAAIAIIVLLVACANVANLFLARAVSRRREIALRLALGVSRARLLRQVLTETLLLAVAGGVLGLIVARWGGAAVRALFLPTNDGVAVFSDLRTLLATSAATLGAALVTGLVPATQAPRQNLAESLTAGGRDGGGRHSTTRSMLLVFQAAFSVLLLVGAGLFVRSLINVRTLHLGYDADRVLVITRNSRGVTLTPAQQIALDERMAAAARATPGVEAAASAPTIPFWTFEMPWLSVPGIDSVDRRGDFVLQAADTSYFRTLGTELVHGRGFGAGDGPTSPPVVIVSEGMASTLWPGQSAIGRCIRISFEPLKSSGSESALPCRTVVGVAEDVRSRSLSDPHQFMYYMPLAQYHEPTSMVFVRVAGNAPDFAESVRRSMQRVMPGAAYVRATPLRTIVDPQMQSWRIGAMMFAAFGGLALVLAAVGLYSVIAYSVAQRRRELGVRIALGALPEDVVVLVLRGGLQVIVAGIAVGSLLALGAGRWAAGLLFHESPTDPAVYAIVAGVLVGVSLVAMTMPALAAARVDATTTLRAD